MVSETAFWRSLRKPGQSEPDEHAGKKEAQIMTALEYLDRRKPNEADPNYWDCGITFKAVPIDTRPDCGNIWREGSRHFRCTFTNKPKSGARPRKFTCHFTQGSAHTEPPKAHEVLDCLILDAQGADGTFKDWVDNYGYCFDSISALKIYRKCRETRKRLHIVFPGWETITESL